MSFIKEKPFVAAVGAVTLLGIVGLGYFITQQGSRYSEALETYQDAEGTGDKYKRMNLFPTVENQKKKKAAVEAYEAGLQEVRGTMASYKPASLKDVTSNTFTTDLKAEIAKSRAAFEEAGTVLPDNYALGFESYTVRLPRQEATGELSYQLKASTWLLNELVKGKPSELISIRREELAAEKAGKETPNGIIRMPYELIFQGSEQTLRMLLTSISESTTYFYAVKAMRVANNKSVAPSRKDVKFLSVKGDGEDGDAEDAPEAAGFVIPGQSTPVEVAPEPKKMMSESGGEMILSQVLGNEEITAFLSLDLVVLPSSEQASNQ